MLEWRDEWSFHVEFLYANSRFPSTMKVTATITVRLQAVFKTVFKPSSSRLQDRLQACLQAVFKTLRRRELAAELAPRDSEHQNCGFQGACVVAVTPFVV